MKKSTFVITCTSAIALAVIGLISHMEQDESQPMDSAPHKWEVYLQYALKNGANNERQLALKAYSYRGKVKTEEEKRQLADEMFGDDAYTIIYKGGDFANPIIETWGNVKDIRKNYYEEVRAGTEADIVIGETDVIDLKWTFKSKTYYSVAIADPKGEPIYDNIASHATSKRTSYQSSRMIILGNTKEESLNTYRTQYEIHDYTSDTTHYARSEIRANGYSYLENSEILTNWIMQAPHPSQKQPQIIQPQPIDRANVDLP